MDKKNIKIEIPKPSLSIIIHLSYLFSWILFIIMFNHKIMIEYIQIFQYTLIIPIIFIITWYYVSGEVI